MKITALSLLFVVLLSSNAHAHLRFGGLLGYRANSATVDNTAVTTQASTTGYNAGGLFWWGFLDTVGLRTGLIYSTKDFDSSISAPGVTGTFKTKVTYLDIPVNVQVDFPFGLYVFGGLKYGLKSTSSVEANVTGTTISSDLASSNTVFNAGAGYNFLDLEIVRLGLEAEYELGNSNIGASSTVTKTKGLGVNIVASVGF
ncbi:MAG: PorT family protein [Oligoflexia bacterium]|nr:PorT family protein [Oligoflexia bacterium]